MMQDTISADLTNAMKARDALKVEVLRGLKAAFTNALVASSRKPTDPLSDEDVVGVIRKEVKKRKESIEAFTNGGRAELADKEQKEQTILEAYLPALMSRDDIKKVVDQKKAEMGVTDKKDMGKFMGAVMKDLTGKADGADVKAVIDESFA